MLFSYYSNFHNFVKLNDEKMKKQISMLALASTSLLFAQSTLAQKNMSESFVGLPQFNQLISASPDLLSLHNDVPVILPKKVGAKYGYINQKGKMIIQPDYYIAMFFSEDCNLLNSPNENVKKFGTNEYATVEKDQITYRINFKGEKVYQYKDSDLGKCVAKYSRQRYSAFQDKNYFGVIDNLTFKNPKDRSQFQIIPQYDLLHIMEGSDVNNPMIIAVSNNKFGVINKNNKIIIPFEYMDIKKNFSWKLGGVFEVSKDGKTYKYVDVRNKSY